LGSGKKTKKNNSENLKRVFSHNYTHGPVGGTLSVMTRYVGSANISYPQRVFRSVIWQPWIPMKSECADGSNGAAMNVIEMPLYPDPLRIYKHQ
jgi:hypothetical protein